MMRVLLFLQKQQGGDFSASGGLGSGEEARDTEVKNFLVLTLRKLMANLTQAEEMVIDNDSSAEEAELICVLQAENKILKRILAGEVPKEFVVPEELRSHWDQFPHDLKHALCMEICSVRYLEAKHFRLLGERARVKEANKRLKQQLQLKEPGVAAGGSCDVERTGVAASRDRAKVEEMICKNAAEAVLRTWTPEEKKIIDGMANEVNKIFSRIYESSSVILTHIHICTPQGKELMEDLRSRINKCLTWTPKVLFF